MDSTVSMNKETLPLNYFLGAYINYNICYAALCMLILHFETHPTPFLTPFSHLPDPDAS
jgi:hypothetical protein